MDVIEYDLGDKVICDTCGTDFTLRTDAGGFIFESKGICPDCAPRFLKTVKLYEEEHFIKCMALPTVPFRDFILWYRGDNNKVRITSW